MADPWKADTTAITADETEPTADGATGGGQWTADTTHFTVDDNLYHTADGWHQDDVGWTADTTHFTVDDDVNHTADGWHDDTGTPVSGGGGGGGTGIDRKADAVIARRWIKRLQDDDVILLQVIEEFLDKAA